MAFKTLVLTCCIMVALSGAPAFATDYVVGDEWGWRLGFDYAAWAQGKEFFVGDTILFHYAVGAHNVYKVNGTGFQQCSVPPPSEALTSGFDKITLATSGRKWYICGVGKHCVNGMKLVITVSTFSPSPAPTPAYRALVMQGKKPMSFWSNWKLKIHS
ncbi:hypothetical protein ACS0TY_004421 [Phlomoides rotata]